MSERKTILELMRKIIAQETRYHRHYLAQVKNIDDPDTEGKIRVIIPEIGWDEDDKVPWVRPRAMNGLQLPKVDQWVEVYFMNGNMTMPVYIGQAIEMEGGLPGLYEKDYQVIFCDPDNVEGIRYDKAEGVLELLDATQSFVKGDDFQTQIDRLNDKVKQLFLDFTTWVPVPMDGGAALKTLIAASSGALPNADMSDILSDKIKGQ